MKRVRTMWTMLLAGALVFPAAALRAQETPAAPPPAAPAGEPISVQDAAAFMGDWALTIESSFGTMEGSLNFKEADGKVVSEIKIREEAPAATITDITKTEQGIRLRYDFEMGSQKMQMEIKLKTEAEGLVGTLADSNNMFTAQLKASRPGEAPAGGDGGAVGDGLRAQRGGGGRRRGGSGVAKLTLGGADIQISHGETKTDHADYAAIAKMKTGDVIVLTESAALKLKTPVDLKFGDAVIKKGNVSPDYPGVYALWLKKQADGWTLVFNNEADVWGTMYNPAANAAEIKIAAAGAATPSETLKVELKEENGAGQLKISWGDYEWTAPFAKAE